MSEPTITKRFVLTRAEDTELNAFLLRLQTASGCKVPLSVVVRAALAILMENEERIAGAAERIHPQLPSTHDRVAVGQFEEQWRGVWWGRWGKGRDEPDYSFARRRHSAIRIGPR